MTKNANIDKCKYYGYGIEFNRHGSFSTLIGGFGFNLIILGVDMKSSVHVDNLILGERLDGTILTAKKGKKKKNEIKKK